MNHSLNIAKAFRIKVSRTGSPIFSARDLKVKRMPRRSKGIVAQQDSGTAQECLDAAAHYEQRAASAIDPAAKATFADAARCWHELARCWRELQRQPAPVDFTRPSST